MNKYGQTWWGEQWLQALHNIDFSNRLPRGRTYANKGYVSDIKIKRNKIWAEVQGSRIDPYVVSCIVPELSKSDKRIIMDKIHSNPMSLTNLVNLELPIALCAFAAKRKIQIFNFKNIKEIKNVFLANNILNGITLNNFIEVFK